MVVKTFKQKLFRKKILVLLGSNRNHNIKTFLLQCEIYNHEFLDYGVLDQELLGVVQK